MQFAPGKRWAYNNSAYILLGAIIEQLSGQSYEQFIQQNIFDPLGMKHSYYDSPLRIIPRRVPGYERGADGYTNAAYLSMTQPYAGGALASTVDDLALWDAALYTEQLISQESIQRAFTPYRLLDGTITNYGYGWAIGECMGHRTVEHGGGIHGFETYMLRMPDDHIFVALLSNTIGGVHVEYLAYRVAALVAGHPYQEPNPVALDSNLLAQYVGEYEADDSRVWQITRAENQLFATFKDETTELIPRSPTEFFFKHLPLSQVRFVRDADDSVIALTAYGRYGPARTATRITTPAPLETETGRD